MPIFAFPWAFLGLFAAGGLAAVYLLRNRSRQWPVSSLMLWTFPTRPKHGGRTVQRIQLPLLFFLELLAILLIVFAAAGPRIRTQTPKQMVVVLDDSFSMHAGGETSARDQAVEALLEILDEDEYVVHLLQAGLEVDILGKGIRSRGRLKQRLKKWTCLSPAARLEKAVTLGNEMCPQGRILVLTDHAPTTTPQGGRIEWHGFGLGGGNFAVVNAVRTAHDKAQRVLLEVAYYAPGFSDGKTTGLSTLTITGENLKPRTIPLTLTPGTIRQIVFDLPENTPAITATLAPDALRKDNQAILLPEEPRRVRVKTDISNSAMQRPVQRALEASDLFEQAYTTPDLLITDQPETPTGASPSTWTLTLLTSKNAKPLVGPFVVDQSHPLTEGLSLEGVVWAADMKKNLPGRPVILAGNTPLLTDAEHVSGRHSLRMQFTPKLSTLQSTPNWPVLLCNLLRWRSEQKPGLAQSNIRLGWQARIALPRPMESVNVIAPDEEKYTIPAPRRTAVVPGRRIGVYRVQASENLYTFACNLISPGESDLSQATPGVWGAWDEIHTFEREYVSVAYVPVLLALAVLIGHMALLRRFRGRGGA